jgi:hypothetical protein
MIWSGFDIVWVILKCHVVHDYQHFVVVPLRHLSADVYLRDVSSSVSLIPYGSIPAATFSKEIYIRNSHTSTIPKGVRRRWGFLIRKPPGGVEIRRCHPKKAWSIKDQILQGKEDDARPSSWHATLELNFSLAAKSGQIAKYIVLLTLGCTHDEASGRPKAWCHVDDTVRYNGVNLEAFHRDVVSRPAQHEVRRLRAANFVALDLTLKVTVTPAKVLSQDMFVVDFQYVELQDQLDTATRSSNPQLLLPSTSIPRVYPGPAFYDLPERIKPASEIVKP